MADKPKKLGRGLGGLLGVQVPVRVEVKPQRDDGQTGGSGGGEESGEGREGREGREEAHRRDASATDASVTNASVTDASVTDAGAGEEGSRAGMPVPEEGTPGGSPAPQGEGVHGVVMVEVGEVGPNRFQPRRVMDEAGVRALAESIRRSGLMQPVVVRPTAGGEVRWELVAGERRWRAAIEAGLGAIPAVVRELTDREAAEWALVENIQREDLNPMDRAFAFRALSENFGLTQQEIAERVGVDRSSVANFMRLTELEEEVAGMVSRGELSAGHGKALLGLPRGERRLSLARRVAGRGLPVRAVEKMVGAEAGRAEAVEAGVGVGERREAVMADVSARLTRALGTRVRVLPRRGAAGAEPAGLD